MGVEIDREFVVQTDGERAFTVPCSKQIPQLSGGPFLNGKSFGGSLDIGSDPWTYIYISIKYIHFYLR